MAGNLRFEPNFKIVQLYDQLVGLDLLPPWSTSQQPTKASWANPS